MWKIRFEDGSEICAYPEEIVPSEKRRQGCTLLPDGIAVKKEPRPGRMYINIDEKIAAAATQEEKEAWEAERADLIRLDTDFCSGWHVGIYKQKCGHWEILQSPLFVNGDGSPAVIGGRPYTAGDADRELREESSKRKCTRCICGWDSLKCSIAPTAFIASSPWRGALITTTLQCEESMMNKDVFWNLISQNRKSTGSDNNKFLEALRKSLSNLEVEQLEHFEGIMKEYFALAFVPGLWDAGCAMNGYCSDDNFMDFRSWLISQGKEVYLAALENPDSLAETKDLPPYDFQAFASIANGIYTEKTGKMFLPTTPLEKSGRVSIYEEIHYGPEIDKLRSGSEIPSYIPRLCKRFLSDRDIAAGWSEWLPNAYKTVWGNARIQAMRVD